MLLAVVLMIVLVVGGSASAQEYDGDFATVETCTGGIIELSGYEKRVLDWNYPEVADNF